jgi:DeoR/GlpR family transcriptional regulator of sugar metabolism
VNAGRHASAHYQIGVDIVFIEERHQAILNTINEKGRISLGDIQKAYDVSFDTARRDLRILEEKGMLKRTHGGAIPILQVGFIPPRGLDSEKMLARDNYNAIAQKAAAMINDGDVVHITGGSFGQIMLSYLPKDISYTLIVNSVSLADKLKMWYNIELYVIGGKIRRKHCPIITDSMATAFVKNLHFDLSFSTGAGLTAEFGLSNSTDETATFQRAVIENSRKNVLLLPSQKIGVNSFVKVTEVEKFDILITDWDAVEDELTKIEEKGVTVIVVESIKAEVSDQ